MTSTTLHATQKSARTLGVIGDVHAEDDRLARAIAFLESRSVDAIVCTGDIVDGKGCPDRSIALLVSANVHTVRGNHDRWILEDKARHVPNAHHATDLTGASREFLGSLPSEIEIDTSAGKLLLCHGVRDNDLKKVWPGTARMPPERCEVMDALLEAQSFRLIINGHMHFRTLIHFESLTLVNAGTLAGERWPGFSLIDFESRTIFAYEFRETDIAMTRSLPLDPQPHHAVWKNTQSFDGNWEPVRLFDAAQNPPNG